MKSRRCPPSARRFENFWNDVELQARQRYGDPQLAQTMAWTNWPLFTVGLVQRGYSDDEIRKIIGGNVLRVAQAVLTT